MADRLRIYSTSWCGACTRLKNGLEREGIAFDDINIETDPDAEAFVLETNNGTATVPTVVLPNGRSMTNPPLPELLAALNAA